ncbi:putative parathyroid hormone 2 receptor [Trichinella spiralis]|uniref:putative parathyroid hormone 2 receptor n=1 Tax=Trichinella spiralis TaxID=6334 RepID=UPI0001EFCC48|nr:putative parathyroid hormone 2 receptor [Trichinella spiralis]
MHLGWICIAKEKYNKARMIFLWLFYNAQCDYDYAIDTLFEPMLFELYDLLDGDNCLFNCCSVRMAKTELFANLHLFRYWQMGHLIEVAVGVCKHCIQPKPPRTHHCSSVVPWCMAMENKLCYAKWLCHYETNISTKCEMEQVSKRNVSRISQRENGPVFNFSGIFCRSCNCRWSPLRRLFQKDYHTVRLSAEWRRSELAVCIFSRRTTSSRSRAGITFLPSLCLDLKILSSVVVYFCNAFQQII